ncbi:DUF3450 domain-containing protein [Bacillus nakamurai]|uniref:DUF3450 domain-containing protein n=1 Tax=Bacillus nakamurai TaxID=1793963 RepID=UPI0020C44AB4|nr:DUF3450 domain-containing protein [Bacillus nakamurai]MCP6683214.1 DUF3450 domain-containing protein [Bacillus nakamurai]
MNQLQEIKKKHFTVVTEYLERNTPFDGNGIKEDWFFLIEQAELAEKQRAIIEEHQRQQDIAVNQFRQAQEEIQRLTKENEELELKVEGQEEEIRDLEFENSNLEDEVEELEDKVEALEGAAE